MNYEKLEKADPKKKAPLIQIDMATYSSLPKADAKKNIAYSVSKLGAIDHLYPVQYREHLNLSGRSTSHSSTSRDNSRASIKLTSQADLYKSLDVSSHFILPKAVINGPPFINNSNFYCPTAIVTNPTLISLP